MKTFNYFKNAYLYSEIVENLGLLCERLIYSVVLLVFIKTFQIFRAFHAMC